MRLCVMVSGSGTNLQAIIDAIAKDELAAQIVLVVSNRRAAYGLSRAEQAGLPTLYFPLKPYASRQDYDSHLAHQVAAHSPDLIVLAGWMHVLSEAFLCRFPHQVINLHPALPAMFSGTDAIRRAFEAYHHGEIAHSGCMVHYAIPEIDAGEVVEQTLVPIFPQDSLETFEARMHTAEHQTLVAAIKHIIMKERMAE